MTGLGDIGLALVPSIHGLFTTHPALLPAVLSTSLAAFFWILARVTGREDPPMLTLALLGHAVSTAVLELLAGIRWTGQWPALVVGLLTAGLFFMSEERLSCLNPFAVLGVVLLGAGVILRFTRIGAAPFLGAVWFPVIIVAGCIFGAFRWIDSPSIFCTGQRAVTITALLVMLLSMLPVCAARSGLSPWALVDHPGALDRRAAMKGVTKVLRSYGISGLDDPIRYLVTHPEWTRKTFFPAYRSWVSRRQPRAALAMAYDETAPPERFSADGRCQLASEAVTVVVSPRRRKEARTHPIALVPEWRARGRHISLRRALTHGRRVCGVREAPEYCVPLTWELWQKLEAGKQGGHSLP